MKFNITALVDEETRKELRELLLGMVKGLTREILTEAIQKEIRTKLDAAQADLSRNDYTWKRNIFDVMRQVMVEQVKTQWPEIGSMLHHAAKEAVAKAVKEKLDNKVIWEATQQREFMKELAQESVREYLKDKFGGLKT